MMNKLIDGYCQAISYLIAAALAVMVVLVFGNVVMRYAFNSGFSVSEELSRWLFVWLTFLGAVVALRENGHLGTDMLVGKLALAGKKFCLALSYVLMLFICWLLFSGAYQQTMINMDTTSAVMEVSMAWIYAPGVVFAVLGGLILLLSVFSYVGMGFFLGARFARRSEEVVVALSAIGVPLLVLGGTFFPLEIMPQGMQNLAQINPMLHMNQAFKGVAAYGMGFHELRFELTFLLVFCGLSLALGVQSYRHLLGGDTSQ